MSEYLIIEDVPYRQNFLKNMIQADQTDMAQKAADGLALLEVNSYDLVFLDHDLLSALSGSHLTLQWAQNRDTFATQKPIVIRLYE